VGANGNRLGSVREIGRKKVKSRSSDTESSGEPREENAMVNCVEGSGEIEKN
jgi:hypothetical protein